MKIVTTAENFVSALKASIKPEKKSSIPVLGCVRIFGNQITSTDLDLWSVLDFEFSTMDSPEVSFLIPYYQTLSVLSGEKGPLTIDATIPEPLPPATILAHAPDCPSALSHYEDCACGYDAEQETRLNHPTSSVKFLINDCEFKFECLDVANYPTIPDAVSPTLIIDGKEFKRLTERTMFAISQEASRYTLNGALLRMSEDTVKLVGTDGHRLSLAETANATGEIADTLIPSSALEYLKARVNGSISIGVSSGWITFLTNGIKLIVRKMGGTFPNYEAVMPRESKITATISSGSKLAPILTRVAKCADERSGAVRFTFNGALTMAAHSSDRGAALATFECKATDELTIRLNSEYLIQFLKQVGDAPISVSLRDAQSAAMFSVDNWKYILMPMRM